jgi:flagellar basal body-associated protein FliL
MICQNCHSNVDNDLIFCTSCGVRLIEPSKTLQNQTQQPTEVFTTQTEQQTVVSPKKSNAKWIALIVGMSIFTVVLGFGIFAYFRLNSNKTVTNKSTPKPTQTAKPKPTNQNQNTNIVANNTNSNTNSNANISVNSNANSSVEKDDDKTEKTILDDTVSVDANGRMAFPFKVAQDMTEIDGKVEILEGESYEGYVFIQEIYDENGVNPTFKMFSFGSEDDGKVANIEQVLVKGNYVIVFSNSDGKGVRVRAKFTQKPQ